MLFSGCAQARAVEVRNTPVRAISESDLHRERIVEEYVYEHLVDWQTKGWVPDMRIEPGDKTINRSAHGVGRTGTTCSILGSCSLELFSTVIVTRS